MKKIILALLFLSTLLFISCGDDEDDTPDESVEVSGSLTYGGESFTITNGIVSSTEVSNDIARRSFFLSDGNLVTDGTSVSVNTAFNAIITVTFDATGESTVVADTYDTSSDINGRRVSIRVTTPEDSQEAFTGGEVILSGSGNTFSLTFDAPFRGTILSGMVSGTFENL